MSTIELLDGFFLLQEFDLTIVDKPSKHNVVEYFLSRLTHIIDKDIVDDAYLDEHSRNPWFSNMANYLAIGKFPHHFSFKERCKIIRKSAS